MQAADETGVVVTAEEHQVGGFGNIIAGAILRHRTGFAKPLLLDMVGVQDRFGLSGKPWELVQSFGLTAEHIAERLLNLVHRRKGMLRMSPAEETESPVIECSRCHTVVPFGDFAAEAPLPSSDLCADCAQRDEKLCAACRVRWALTNSNFHYVCREVSVTC